MSSNNGPAHQNAETKHTDAKPVEHRIGRMAIQDWIQHNQGVSVAETSLHDHLGQILSACEHAKSVIPGSPAPGNVAMEILGKIRDLANKIITKDLPGMAFDQGVFVRTIGSMMIDMQMMNHVLNSQRQRLEIMETNIQPNDSGLFSLGMAIVGLADQVPGALPDGPVTAEIMKDLSSRGQGRLNQPAPEPEPVQAGETMPEIDQNTTDQPAEPTPEDGQAG